jgi:hypothetical protein
MLARAPSLPSARFVHASIAELPPDLGGFDVVFACLVLEHVEELGPVLRAAASASREGALFKAYELHAARRRAGTRAHFRAPDGAEHALPSFAHDERELRAALEAAGFDGVETRDWIATPEACARSAKACALRGRAGRDRGHRARPSVRASRFEVIARVRASRRSRIAAPVAWRRARVTLG